MKAIINVLLAILALMALALTSIAFAGNDYVTNDAAHPVPVTSVGISGGNYISAPGSTPSPSPAMAVTVQGNASGIPIPVGGATTGSAVPASGVFTTGRAATANPANATGGNAVGVMADKAGRFVVTEGNVRELIGVQTTTISASTSETTIVTAGGAGVFNDISQINITTTNTAAAVLTLKDSTGGTTRAVWNFPATAANPINPFSVSYPIPMPQATANANWTLTCSVNAGNFIVNVVYVKNL
jgi:hypothetical protein